MEVIIIHYTETRPRNHALGVGFSFNYKHLALAWLGRSALAVGC